MATDPSSPLAMNATPTRLRAGVALLVAAVFGVGAVSAVQALEAQSPCTLDPALASNTAIQPLECGPFDGGQDGLKPKAPVEAQKITKRYGSGYQSRGLKLVNEPGAGPDDAASSPRVGPGESRTGGITGLAGRPYGGGRGGGAGSRRGR